MQVFYDISELLSDILQLAYSRHIICLHTQTITSNRRSAERKVYIILLSLFQIHLGTLYKKAENSIWLNIYFKCLYVLNIKSY
jgi:hypothetical protein